MKKFLLLASVLAFTFSNAQNVNIPDANFKAALVADLTINTNADTDIQLTEAATYSGSIDVNSLNIVDLTGIEAFTSLTGLTCYTNSLTTLDLSANTALTGLVCYNNSLTSLDLSANTLLTNVNCSGNQLASLKVAGLAALSSLWCDGNLLTRLNVSNCASLVGLVCSQNLLDTLNLTNTPSLVTLWCANNQLDSLDLSTSPALNTLYCYFNTLTKLDLTANTSLASLACYNNQLTSINFTGITSITSFICYNNQLTALDVSTLPSIIDFACNDNLLTSLSVKDGNNINFNSFDARNNANLVCIEVDSVAYSVANWTAFKDAGASFSTNCSTSLPTHADASLFSFLPNPASDHFIFLAQTPCQLDIFDLHGKRLLSASAASQPEIDVNELGPGVYTLLVKTAQGVASKKLVIAR